MKKMMLAVVAIAVSMLADAQFSEASLQASGLTCSMCSKAVKVALEKIPFVRQVKVNIKNQEYSITFKENSNVEFDALKNAVEDAGFSVASLKIKGNFSDLKIQKDKHVQVAGKNFHFLNGYNQVLHGERTITVVDKDFVAAKEFKKYSNASEMKCVASGKAADCCTKEGIQPETRVYHVII